MVVFLCLIYKKNISFATALMFINRYICRASRVFVYCMLCCVSFSMQYMCCRKASCRDTTALSYQIHINNEDGWCNSVPLLYPSPILIRRPCYLLLSVTVEQGVMGRTLKINKTSSLASTGGKTCQEPFKFCSYSSITEVYGVSIWEADSSCSCFF